MDIDTTPEFYAGFCEEAQDELDDIDMTNVLAFTWTPNPIKYPSSQPRQQYKCLLKHILLAASKYFRLFVFVPELNTNGNVHIHGWYIIKDRIAYFKHFLPRCKQLGYVLVKKGINTEWFDYVNKDVDDTVDVIGADLPVPLTHLNCGHYKGLWKKKTGIKYVPRKMDLTKLLFKK